VINGVRLYYERHGDSGEPLVFVHGYTGDISDWRPQLPEFSPGAGKKKNPRESRGAGKE
jgi:pimeloyl-ACP methyl ester carboxylesterase